MTHQTQDKTHKFQSELKALRLKQVLARTGLSRSSIYAKAKAGEFPTPFKLGGGRSSAWLEHEIDQWLQIQVDASRLNCKQGGCYE